MRSIGRGRGKTSQTPQPLRESAKARLAGPLPFLEPLRDLVALAFFSFVRLLLGLRLLERAWLLLLVRLIRLAVAPLVPAGRLLVDPLLSRVRIRLARTFAVAVEIGSLRDGITMLVLAHSRSLPRVRPEETGRYP